MKLNYLLLVLLLSYFYLPNISSAQITFDSNPVANNSAGTGNTVEVTVPMGNDRLLIAMIGTNDLFNTPTVLFDGEAMVKAGEDDDNFNATYNAKVLVYYLALGDGAAITNNITVSNLTNYYTVSGLSFQGVDQNTPVKQAVQAPIPTGVINSSQIAASITGVSEDNLLFAFFGEDNVKQFDWAGDYIAGGTHANTGVDADGYYYATYNAAAAAGNHTFTYDINNGIQSCAGVLIEFAQKTSLPSVSIALSPTSATENSSATLDYTFTVNPAPASDLTVNFTISGTAEDDDDFTVSTPSTNNETVSYTTNPGTGNNTGTITIKAGETTGLLRITPTSDTDVEVDESVIVTVNN